jgi:hypothetical protein
MKAISLWLASGASRRKAATQLTRHAARSRHDVLTQPDFPSYQHDIN